MLGMLKFGAVIDPECNREPSDLGGTELSTVGPCRRIVCTGAPLTFTGECYQREARHPPTSTIKCAVDKTVERVRDFETIGRGATRVDVGRAR